MIDSPRGLEAGPDTGSRGIKINPTIKPLHRTCVCSAHLHQDVEGSAAVADNDG